MPCLSRAHQSQLPHEMSALRVTGCGFQPARIPKLFVWQIQTSTAHLQTFCGWKSLPTTLVQAPYKHIPPIHLFPSPFLSCRILDRTPLGAETCPCGLLWKAIHVDFATNNKWPELWYILVTHRSTPETYPLLHLKSHSSLRNRSSTRLIPTRHL